MDVPSLIECYVGDVTAQLPRKMRRDVADELRSLLGEELQARAEAAGRAGDPAMAMELLQGFGRPADVAARYHPTFAIVEPTDTRAFLTAAILGVVVISLLGAPAIAPPGQNTAPGLLTLAWLGALVLYYGIKGWNARRHPEKAVWRPRDRDHVARFGSAALVAIILCGIVAYGAPQWLFATLTGGIKLPTSLSYAPDFEQQRLHWLLAVWGLTALLYAVLVVKGRWQPSTRWIGIALNLAVTGLLIWYRYAGPMFQVPHVDAIAKSFLPLIIVIMLMDTAFRIYTIQNRIGRS